MLRKSLLKNHAKSPCRRVRVVVKIHKLKMLIIASHNYCTKNIVHDTLLPAEIIIYAIMLYGICPKAFSV
jgi:hypothetical protein